MTTNQIITIHSVLKSAYDDAEAKTREAAHALVIFKNLHGIDGLVPNVKSEHKAEYDRLFSAMKERSNESEKCALALNAFLGNEWN